MIPPGVTAVRNPSPYKLAAQRKNNPLERILREIRRRARVVGAFPDGQSALDLAAARPRHIARRGRARDPSNGLLKD